MFWISEISNDDSNNNNYNIENIIAHQILSILEHEYKNIVI